ncbi:efflux RND transporter periplasmic adaptor subunit [Oceanisphaera sp.]|uniref:efflux RND transporter periplasmic adaptor subunit n=1 Tax=Oceanisphaera sp. TaxID=1929979 RepID=UPI003A9141BB
MKNYVGLFTGLVLLSLLGGCGEQAPETAVEEVVRPAQIMEVSAQNAASGLRFPGRVRAVQRAELAFNLPGRIVEMPVQEGQQIEKGALVARLDAENAELQLASAQAEYNKARTDYNRVQQIWQKSQAVAKAEVDQKRTAMEVARSRYLAAKKEVADMRLIAPFAGVVVKRQVENFSNVQAKEPIVSLQDTSNLEIVINVPERVVRSEPKQVAGLAIFADYPDQPLPVSLKSFSTEANAQTQSYEVVLSLEPGYSIRVLPGMSVEIQPRQNNTSVAAQQITVPLQAIVSTADGDTQVWLVDAETSRVHAKTVTLGKVQDSSVVVLGGLQGGERIVTAGVSQLRENMQVRPL